MFDKLVGISYRHKYVWAAHWSIAHWTVHFLYGAALVVVKVSMATILLIPVVMCVKVGPRFAAL